MLNIEVIKFEAQDIITASGTVETPKVDVPTNDVPENGDTATDLNQVPGYSKLPPEIQEQIQGAQNWSIGEDGTVEVDGKVIYTPAT